MNEIWSTLIYQNQNFDNKYKISNTGKVINAKTGKERSLKIRNGFQYVDISFNNKQYPISIHILVAKLFLPNPNDFKYVLFKDGNRQNCCVDNLIWSDSPAKLPNENKLDFKKRQRKLKNSSTRNTTKLKKKRQILKQNYINYKGGCCQICGYKKCTDALEFHHVNPKEKTTNISKIIFKSWEIVKTELDKCILVCSNCHGEIENGDISLDQVIKYMEKNND